MVPFLLTTGCMRLAYVIFATRIVSSISNVQHFHDSCTQHEKYCRNLKHVLKPHDSRRHNQMLE